MSAPLLQVTGLSRAFGGVQAVDGVGFSLLEGEMLALIGPNGAGKSTTFNMVGGQLRPDAGDVLLSGNFAEIEKWQDEQAYERTRRLRPDLLDE